MTSLDVNSLSNTEDYARSFSPDFARVPSPRAIAEEQMASPEMTPDQRFAWLVDQNSRAQIATAQMNGRTMTQDEATLTALRSTHAAITDPVNGKKFLGWLTGNQQRQFKGSYAAKLQETGDAMLALRHAETAHGYQPPMLTMDGNPDLAKFDPAKLQQQAAGQSTFRDWVMEPVLRFGAGAAQGVVDLGIGVANLAHGTANLVGFDIPKIAPRDVYTRAKATFAAMAEGRDRTESDVRAQEIARGVYDPSRSLPMSLLQGGTDTAGEIYWMMRGLARALFSAAPAGASTLEKLGRGAAGFGVYNFITSEGGAGSAGERSIDAMLGGVAGAVGVGAQALYKAAFRAAIARVPSGASEAQIGKMLGRDGRAAEAFMQWAAKNGLTQPASGETFEAFLRRGLSQYVAAGAPNAPTFTRQLVGNALGSLAESGAYSLADVHFAKDLWSAVISGDGDAAKRALESWGSNALGIAFLHAGSRFDYLRRAQRSQPTDTAWNDQQPQGPQGPTPPLRPGEIAAPQVPRLQDAQPSPQGPPQLPRVTKTGSDAAVEETRQWARSELRDQELGDRFAPDAKPRAVGVPDGRTPQVDPESSLAAETAPQAAIQAGYTPPPPKLLTFDMTRYGWVEDVDASLPGEFVAEQMAAAAKDATVGERFSNAGRASGDAVPLDPESSLAAETVSARQEAGRRDAAIGERFGRSVNPPAGPPNYIAGIRAQFADSPFSFVVNGDVARPNQKLREATGLPEAMPKDQFLEVVAKMTLANQLQAKAVLPGEEITATGMKADAKSIDEPAVIRTMRFGEVIQRPLSLTGSWTPAAPFEPRKPDPLPPEQQQVGQFLEQVAQRQDLAPEDAAVLGSAIGVLGTVGAQVDPAVAETVSEVLQGPLAQMLQADPQTAGDAIQAIGEMLTTKSPEVAITDLASKTQERATTAQQKAQAAYDDAKAAVEALGPEPPKPSSEKKAFGKGGKEKADPEAVARWETETKAYEAWRRKRTALKKAETSAANKLERESRPMRKTESGAVDPLAVVLALPRAALRVVAWIPQAPILGAGLRSFGEDMIDRVERIAGKAWADEFRKQATRFREVRGELQEPVQKLGKIAQRPHPQLSEIHWVGGSGFDMLQILRESNLQRWLGMSRANLDPQAIEILEQLDALQMETRAMASAAGLPSLTGAPVAPTTTELRHTRQFTDVGAELIRDLDEDFIKSIAAIPANNLTAAQVRDIFKREGFVEARSLHRSDAVETRRQIPIIPAFWRDNNGRQVRILETRPIHHAETMVNAFANRLSLFEVFGPDTAAQNAVRGDTPYADLIAKGADPRAQPLLAEAFRQASGMSPVKASDAAMAIERWMQTWVDPLVTVWSAAKLTGVKAALQNVLEPLGTAASVLGVRNVLDSYREVATRIVQDRGPRKLMEELADYGGYLPMTHDLSPETAQEYADIAARVIRSVFDTTQGFTELVIANAARNTLERALAGQARASDVGLPLLLGYSAADAQRIAAGRGTPEEYGYIREHALGKITGQGAGPLERTQASRLFRKLRMPFLSFAQKQNANYLRLSRAVREARTPGEKVDAETALLRFLAGNLFAGLATWVLGTGLTKGFAEMWATLGDIGEDPLDATAKGLFFQLFGGAGSFITNAAELAMADDDSDKVQLAKRIVGVAAPVSALMEAAALTKALVPGNEGADDSRYHGKSFLGKVWTGVQILMPLAKDIDRGMFGIAAIAPGVDPTLSSARERMFKWREKHAPETLTGGFQPTDFTAWMKQWELAVREAPDSVDAADLAMRIAQTLPEGHDRKGAARSLRNRQAFGDWFGKLDASKREDLLSYLGSSYVATLRGYDYALEQVARRVDPSWLLK